MQGRPRLARPGPRRIIPPRMSISTPEVPPTPPGGPGPGEDTTLKERRALAWSALAAVAVIVWIVMPVGVGIFLGTLMGFAMQPLYERLRARLRPSFAALLSVGIVTVAIIATVGGLGYLFITKGVSLTHDLLAELGPGGSASGVVEKVTAGAASLGFSSTVITAKVREGAAGAAERAAGIAELLASATASGLLGLFFAMLTMYFAFRHWPGISARAQAVLPLRPDYTRSLLEEFRRIGRATLLGTIVTGLAQGLLATIGYAVAGVPEPIFFGAMTAVASLIPAVGTLIVWVPAGVVLIVMGHAGRGVLVLAWSALVVVGVSDYVIRPKLVGGEGETPAIVTFAALFGGVEVWGLKGLIMGPVLVLLAVAVLRIYVREEEARHTKAASDLSAETP
jgi:predicted PurR-regulated permease PerM